MIRFNTLKQLCVLGILSWMNSSSASAIDLDFWHPLDLDVYVYQSSWAERRVAHISSDAMDGATDLLLELGPNQEIRAFRLVTSSGAAIEFPVEKLREGAVLKTDRGLNGETLHTLTLQSDDFNSITGGDVKLIYLVNGAPFMQKYKEFETRLRPNETSQWVFHSGNDGHPFNSMFLRANHMFGKVVGISSVEVDWDSRIKYVP